MSDMVFWGALGMFIGWNVPAPFWATWAWEKMKGWVKSTAA